MSTSSGGVSDNIREYGTVVDRRRSRVRCNYCAKVVSGFTRLKQHLGGVRGDVVPCHLVPQQLNIHMRNALLETKNHRLSREVVQLISSINVSAASATTTTTTTTTSSSDELIEFNQSNAKGKKRNHVSLDHNVVLDTLMLLPNSSAAAAAPAPAPTASASTSACGTINDSLTQLHRCIGRFFYENGIEFSAATSTSFSRMTNAIIECAPNNYKIPSCEELRGRILLDELQVIRRHVMAVKRSWVTTGCSVLLDGWTDGNGRTLINFLVDSPGGPIFLRSADVSGFHKDVNAMSSLLDGVIEEVGIENVVQVVAYSPSACMDALGKRLTQKHRSMFWTVCASHCIGLMLEKIEALALTKKILDKAKIITRFIYSHAMVLRLMRMHCGVRDMVRPSKIKSAASFLTLANIVSESKNLKSMFNSFAWNTSTWASTSAGKMVADLVGESSSFWGEAGMVLKATIPLVRVVQLLNGEDGKHQVGYIYESMDQAKEAIKMEFGNKKAKYLPLWKIIDEIWDNHLHSPIHSAGYYFNPSFFYSSHFFSDAEVASGLLCCIVRMVEDPNTQDLISLQMDEYRMAKGGFGEQNAVEQRRQISPAEWWSRYGGKCPELQRFAIRILSQTCSGGLRYQLRRSLSEQMHTHGRNNVEQQRLTDLTFVHHNLQLQQQQHSSIIDRYNMDIIVKDMDAMKDWVVAPDHQTCPNSSDSDWVFSDCNGVDTASGNLGGVVPPGFSLKQEAFGDI